MSTAPTTTTTPVEPRRSVAVTLNAHGLSNVTVTTRHAGTYRNQPAIIEVTSDRYRPANGTLTDWRTHSAAWHANVHERTTDRGRQQLEAASLADHLATRDSADTLDAIHDAVLRAAVDRGIEVLTWGWSAPSAWDNREDVANQVRSAEPFGYADAPTIAAAVEVDRLLALTARTLYATVRGNR